MPYPNQHAARMRDPDDFVDSSFRTKELTDGVTGIMGKLKSDPDGSMVLQACRFDKDKFTPAEARKWLKDNDMKPMMFEEATERKDNTSGLQTVDLKDVEIFAAGEWTGSAGAQVFSETDIAEIVSDTNEVFAEIKPFVKLSHDEEQSLVLNAQLPAAGWLENIRNVGGKIIADIKDVPKLIADIIAKSGYRRVSAELAVGYKSIAGRVYSKVLTAVAFLGGELPAVTSLADLPRLYHITNVPAFKLRMQFTQELKGVTNVADESKNNKPPDVVTFSRAEWEAQQTQFKTMSEQVAQLLAKSQEYAATIQTQATTIQTLQQQETAREHARRRILVEEFCSGLKERGCLLPKEEPVVIEFLQSLQAVPQVLKFKTADGSEKESSAFDRAIAVFGQLLADPKRQVVQFGEQSLAPTEYNDLRAEARATLKAAGVPVKEDKQNG